MDDVFEGFTTSDALISACTALGVTRDELRHEVLPPGPTGRARIRVLGVERRLKEVAAIDYQTALAPLRRWFEQRTGLVIRGELVEVALVDYDWLQAQDEAYWQTKEHDDDRAMQLWSWLSLDLARLRLVEDGLWGICGAVGVAGTYWHEHGFHGSDLHGLLVLDLRRRVGASCPVLYFDGGPDVDLLAESAEDLAVEVLAGPRRR
jgi:hypothetical protein